MYATTVPQGSGGLGTGLIVGGATGSAATLAAVSAKKYMQRTNVGLGLSMGIGALGLIGGNANNTEAANVATLANTTNSLTFTAGGATGPEVGALKQALVNTQIELSKIASNTDYLTNAGLRNPPTLPTASAASTASTVPAPVNTTPASGLGNIGYLMLGGVAIWLLTRD